jgi:hypothetical protein
MHWPSQLEHIRCVLTKRHTLRLPTLHECVHKGEHFAHMTYLGFVSVEVKYWYGKVAAVMLVLTIIGLFLHEEGAEAVADVVSSEGLE